MFLKFSMTECAFQLYNYQEDTDSIVMAVGRVLFPVWNDGKHLHPGEGIISLN